MKTLNTASSSWLMHVKGIVASKTFGQFSTKDSNELPIIIEWEKIDPKTIRLTEKIKLVSPLLIKAYSEIETEFARKKPESIATDMFLKSLEPLLKDGLEKVDWNLAKKKITLILNDFFTKMDWSMYSKPDELHFFMTAKNEESKDPLGVIQFIISPEHAFGTVKVELYDGIESKAPNNDLQKILLSSIFKLIPDINRIFFHTRITNLTGIKIHKALGFTEFPGNLQNWLDLEYKIEKSKTLQRFSLTFD